MHCVALYCVAVRCGAVGWGGVRCGAVRQACVKPGPSGVLGVSRVGKPLQDDGAGGTRRDRPRQGSRVMPGTILYMDIRHPCLHLRLVLLIIWFDNPVMTMLFDHPVDHPIDDPV